MKKVLTFVPLLFACICLDAQVINYKKLGVPKVDGSGNILDKDGKKWAKLERNGSIYNLQDQKIAYHDAFGYLLEVETDNKIGKCDQNGNFVVDTDKIKINWKSNQPEMQGIDLCLIKDPKGNMVGAVHKGFKQYGTGALFYLMKLNDALPADAVQTATNKPGSPSDKVSNNSKSENVKSTAPKKEGNTNTNTSSKKSTTPTTTKKSSTNPKH